MSDLKSVGIKCEKLKMGFALLSAGAQVTSDEARENSLFVFPL